MNPSNLKILFLQIIFSCLVFSGLYSQNYVTTYAGTGVPGSVDGDTSVASFNRPFGMCIDPEGNLYVADSYNSCIRKIGIDGQVSIYAGSGIIGYQDGPANEARFNQPINVCLDDEGNMYVSDFINQRIRKVSTDMQVTTVAGTGVAGFQNGEASQAQFNYPRGICVDESGNIYIGDSWNHRIRKISTDGMVSTYAGGGDTIGVQSVGGYIDAMDTNARFYTPCELSLDQYNNIYVADAYNHRIRKIDADRMVTTIAGSGDSGPDSGGFQNGEASIARFNVPTACHVTIDGTIFVGDGVNQRVRKIGVDQMVSTFAGSGETGFENGPDSLATFDFPRGTVYDYNLNRLYVVDYQNHAIRIVHDVIQTGTIESPDILQVKVFPNPFKNACFIEYELNNPAVVQIKIFNHLGKEIDVLVDGHQPSDLYQLRWNSDNLPCGIYFITLKTDKDLQTVKMVKVE